MCEQKLSVFSADYWRAARRELNNPRVLAFSGLVCAMAIVLESLPIYLLGPSLKIYFSFLAVSLGCMCYGPVVGMMAGAIIDTVGFLLASYGEPYFPGYLITAMLSGLIYGVMLYRQKPTLPRIIVTRLIINYGSNGLRPACYLDSDLLISVEDDEATDDVTPEHAGEIIAALAEQFGGTFATEDQLTTALSFMLGTLRATREKEARHE